jgi:hypothetical protein
MTPSRPDSILLTDLDTKLAGYVVEADEVEVICNCLRLYTTRSTC